MDGIRVRGRDVIPSTIIISSDSSDESVGSPPSRVILFGDIPTVIPSTSVVAPETSTIAPVISSAAPMVETTLVASPTGLYGLVPYTGSDSDSPDEMCRFPINTSLHNMNRNKKGEREMISLEKERRKRDERKRF
ncbi:hypothetical protein Tco_1180605, partial [Tanacetum coccineum]